MGPDAAANVTTVRTAIGHYLHQWKPDTELQSLRRTLSACCPMMPTIVLDLHCDCEGVMHFYTEEPCWRQLEPLAHLLAGAKLSCWPRNSGSGPFDECLSGVWWQLAEASGQRRHAKHLCRRAATAPPLSCAASPMCTHAWAQSGRPGHVCLPGTIAGTISRDAAPSVPAAAVPTPHHWPDLQTLHAPVAGRCRLYRGDVGQDLWPGDLVAEVIDPIEQHPPRAYSCRSAGRVLCARPRPLRHCRMRARQDRRRHSLSNRATCCGA